LLGIPQPPPFSKNIERLNFSFTNKWGTHASTFYYHTTTKEPTPLVLIAHGLGASKDYHRWMVNILTQQHYVVLAYTLHGNTIQQLFNIVKGAISRGKASFDAFADAIPDSIRELSLFYKLAHIIDFKRIGVMGHSSGAAGLLLVSSQSNPIIRCGIALAPPAYPQTALPSKVNLPIQVQIGTLDRLCPVNAVKNYYEQLKAPVKELIVIKGGNHVQYMDHEMAEVPVRLGIDNPPTVDTDSQHQQSKTGFIRWFNQYL
jgi:dienelactone hydrolase